MSALMRGLALAAVLSVPSRSATPASVPSELRVDPRIELLGVIQHLAGKRRLLPAHAEYLRRVERRFGALRAHPAVTLYAEAFEQRGGHEGFGIILLYFTDPPELALRERTFDPPYLELEADRALMQRWLWELRDFARRSDFAGFFRESRDVYGAVESSARKELGALEPVKAIEELLGVGLNTRAAYLLSPLYAPGRYNSYIIPYPDPVSLKAPPKRPFEVYTLCPYVPGAVNPETAFDRPSGSLWQEPLYVFIDPSLHHFEKGISAPEAFYGASLAGCRSKDVNCVKSLLVAALVDSLNRRAFGGIMVEPGRPHAALIAALAVELEDYAARRERYPTVWDFFPRLLSVFSKDAATRPLSPAKITNAAEFFGRD